MLVPLRPALRPLRAWLPALVRDLGEALDVDRVDLRLPGCQVVVRADPWRLERVLVESAAGAGATFLVELPTIPAGPAGAGG